jgi:hypothetical protein
MDMATTYRKTSHGSDAIAHRHPALGPRQRSLLILVDGHRSVGELATVAAACGNTEELLQGLLAQGFIEPLTVRPAQAAPAAVTAAAVPLAQARSLAVRRLNDLLGPSGTDLCLRLEATHSVPEFRTAIRRVEATLREVVGPQRAAQFVSEVENLRAA